MKAKSNKCNLRKRYSLIFIVSILTALILISAVSCGASTVSTTLETTNGDSQEEHIQNDMLQTNYFLQSSLKSGYSFRNPEDKNLSEDDDLATEPKDQTPPEEETSSAEPDAQTLPEEDTSYAEPDVQTPPKKSILYVEPDVQTPPEKSILHAEPDVQTPPEESILHAEPDVQTPPEEDTSHAEPNSQSEIQLPVGEPIVPPNVKPQKITVHATAYCPKACCNGEKYAYKTASGAEMTLWHTLAGSRGELCYLPLGTVIYIPYFADQPNGGWFVVEDTFRDEKDRYCIDILMETHESCNEFGRRNLEAYVYFV